MKKTLLFAVAILFAVPLLAYNNLIISNPHSWGKRTQGIITDPVIEISPMGIYAQVDVEFKINAQQSYSSTDSLEAVLKFDLPSNSFIHDSWLWLDNVNIIKADIIEKNRAISIYEGIVKRRRDPSLLVKTGANSYQLNVYPMTTNYPRKVKISYSVPMNWLDDRVNVPLPVELLNTSATVPAIMLKINHDTRFFAPGFSSLNFNNYIIASSASQHTLTVPATAYKNVWGLALTYSTNISNGIFIGTYTPPNSNEGYYQMAIQPSALGTTKRKNVVIAVSINGGDIYSYNQVIKYIKSSLHNHYNSVDSFNFFQYSNGIYKAFPSWQPADSGSTENIINTASVGVTTTFEEFLKQTLAFAKTKPGDAQVILVCDRNQYGTSQQSVDAAFNNIKSHIGSFDNKINVINLSTTYQYSSAGIIKGDELLYNKLILSSGGIYYSNNSTTYEYLNNKSHTYYEINISNILKELSLYIGDHTSSYTTDIAIPGGFSYNKFELNGSNRFNLSGTYLETGKYFGTIATGNAVNVQVSMPGGYINQQPSISSIDNGSNHYKLTWVNKYISSLEGFNNGFLTNEIIDSSINNRVLCNYTAFLAVETGDTIKTNVNGATVTTIKDTKKGVAEIKCYPNPFTDNLTIEPGFDATTIEIYDLLGRKIFSAEFQKGETKYTWNGTDKSGNLVSPGFYIIIARSETASRTIKVMKQ